MLVGNHVYSIEWLTNDEWQARHYDEACDAQTHSTVQEIHILLQLNANESHYQEVLWHEITHACWDSCMLTHTDFKEVDNPEEHVIMYQTPQQVFVLKQNPHVVAYLLSDGAEVR